MPLLRTAHLLGCVVHGAVDAVGDQCDSASSRASSLTPALPIPAPVPVILAALEDLHRESPPSTLAAGCAGRRTGLVVARVTSLSDLSHVRAYCFLLPPTRPTNFLLAVHPQPARPAAEPVRGRHPRPALPQHRQQDQAQGASGRRSSTERSISARCHRKRSSVPAVSALFRPRAGVVADTAPITVARGAC